MHNLYDSNTLVLNIKKKLLSDYHQVDDNLFCDESRGYWSNLDKVENVKLVESLKYMSTRNAILRSHPDLFDIIFSSKRDAGLELLELSGNEICIDCGCMWGALTIPLAKRCKHVVGIDQTLNSLKFLSARINEGKIRNIDLICSNLKNFCGFESVFDVAVVNGVLEWIPESGEIELKKYYGKYEERKKYCGDSPKLQQIAFLKKVNKILNQKGKLYIAIENRYDFKMFFGIKDPHANLFFTSFLPRNVSNFLSLKSVGRPYVNWIYSFSGVSSLLKEAGFRKVQLYMCFPDYRFPERIIPYRKGLKEFHSTISERDSKGKKNFKRVVGRYLEYLFFRLAKAKFFAPSIIAVAEK